MKETGIRLTGFKHQLLTQKNSFDLAHAKTHSTVKQSSKKVKTNDATVQTVVK